MQSLMPKIRIFLEMTPPAGTAQQRKINFRTGRTYLPKRVKQTQKAFKDALKPFTSEDPIRGPIRVIQRWFYPFPTSRRRKGINIQPKTTVGDVDNIAKMLNDACTKCGIWTDDRYIYSLTVEKYWVNPETHHVGIEIEIITEDADAHKPQAASSETEEFHA